MSAVPVFRHVWCPRCLTGFVTDRPDPLPLDACTHCARGVMPVRRNLAHVDLMERLAARARHLIVADHHRAQEETP